METATEKCQIDWMQNGAAHTKDHARILSIIDRMEWDYDYRGKDIAMMPALGISEVIKQARIPKVSAVSYTCMELAPFGLYGIEGNYVNGRVRVFVVDEGTALVPICAFVYD
jgi:hypothetical protein